MDTSHEEKKDKPKGDSRGCWQGAQTDPQLADGRIDPGTQSMPSSHHDILAVSAYIPSGRECAGESVTLLLPSRTQFRGTLATRHSSPQLFADCETVQAAYRRTSRPCAATRTLAQEGNRETTHQGIF